MKFIRKTLAVLFLIVFILLLPLSLVLRNAEEPAMSKENAVGLVEELMLIPELADKVIPAIMNSIPKEDTTSEVLVKDAWDALGVDAWTDIANEFGVQDFVASSARKASADIFAWFESDAGTPPPIIDLRDFKKSIISKDGYVTKILLNTQLDCSPEQLELYYPQDLAIIEVKDNLNIIQTNTTVYQLTYTNPNLVTQVQLDDFVLPGLGNLQLRSFISGPGCYKFVGDIVDPGQVTECKFDWENYKLEEILNTLQFETTVIEPEMDHVVCRPPDEIYDDYAGKFVNPTVQIFLNNTANEFSDVLTYEGILTEEVHQYVQQGRQVAQYGWISMAGLFFISVLLGAGFTREILGWSGWPLLLAGGITMGFGFAFSNCLDVIWSRATPYIGTGISVSVLQPFRLVIDKVISAVIHPTLIQGEIIFGVGFVLVVLSFVFRKSRGVVRVESAD